MNNPKTRLERYPWGVAAFTCLAAIFFWSANDASFPMTVHLAKAKLGVRHPDGWGSPPNSGDWNQLGKRLFLLYGVLGSGVLTVIALAARCAKTRRKTAFVLTALVIAGWVTFYNTQQAIDDWRCMRQLEARMDDFEAAAEYLGERWPTKSTDVSSFDSADVPGLGNVLVNRGGSLFVWDIAYSTKLGPGGSVSRDSHGVIQFDLWPSPFMELQYHPNGTAPHVGDAYMSSPKMEISSCQIVKKNWYFVRHRFLD